MVQPERPPTALVFLILTLIDSKVFSIDGQFLRKIGAGYGSAAGQLISPITCLIDPKGDLIVSDHGNNRIQIFG